jgi:Cu(I)/Ag(I) efflux system membrane protein CusA/SilA
MPPLEEGSLLYMPVTQPGLSAVEARRLLTITDEVIAEFPEVARVLGKAGRADTATDPAPPSMLETLIELKPVAQWRHVPRWYSAWVPSVLQPVLRPLWPDRIGREQLVAELDAALRVPGLTNTWTMPIKGRLEMLDSGLRAPLGLKVSGPEAAQTERLAAQVAEALKSLPGTRSVFAERNGLGRYLDIRWRRDALAHAGIRLQDAQETLATAIGGEMTGTVVHQSRRHGVRVRLARDYRDDPAAIRELGIYGPDGVSLWPLAALAEVEFVEAPAMIRNENGMPTSYVTLDLGSVDPAAYLEAARIRLAEQVSVPTGYTLLWAGALAESSSHDNLLFAGALALGTVLLLLLLGTGSLARTAIILLAVPFSAIGAVWLVWLLGFKLSTAVYIGFLALLGVDAATGVFMLLYLDLAWREAAASGSLTTREARCEAVVSGAARRLRPKLMTVTAMLAGLIPILFSTGTGADVMQRMAAPMIGGIVTSFLLELLVYPALYLWYRQRLA